MIYSAIKKLAPIEIRQATELISISLKGLYPRRIHSPKVSPTKPKAASSEKACSGLIRTATAISATISVITLQRSPLRIPQIAIGRGHKKLIKLPMTGTYMLIIAKTMAIAAKMPASTMAEVLRIT